MTFTTERALACTFPPSPSALVGIPAAGESNLPTDLVLVYSKGEAKLFDEQQISLALFELSSSSGATVALTPRLTFVAHFELVPETELEPSTEYTLRATLPPETSGQPSVPTSLSFTTGEGPLTDPPAAPDVKIQHYHSTDDSVTSCDPGLDGSCVFVGSQSPVVLSHPESSPNEYLAFGAWWENLTGVNQGTPYACMTVRSRSADGALSDSVEICRDDAETVTIPDVTGLNCTERGFEHNGVPIAGAGGGSTGGTGGTGAGGSATGGTATGGSASGGVETGGAETGGAETGGTGTGGSGNTAGAPDDSEDDGTRTVMTEGCGCRVPAPANGDGPWAWVAILVSLALVRRRRG